MNHDSACFNLTRHINSNLSKPCMLKCDVYLNALLISVYIYTCVCVFVCVCACVLVFVFVGMYLYVHLCVVRVSVCCAVLLSWKCAWCLTLTVTPILLSV